MELRPLTFTGQRSAFNVVPVSLQPWLYDQGSFITRLKQHHLQPEIQVLKQQWQLPTPKERSLLQLAPRRSIFSREVVIQHQGEDLLFARAVMPATMLTGPERRLRYLGKRSLGSVLFAYPDIKRSEFDVELVSHADALCWERRSIFYFQGKKLLLTEVFLPGLTKRL